MWGISIANHSTSIFSSATSVASTVFLRASYMERMQLFSQGTLLHFAILALLVMEYPEYSRLKSDTKHEPQQTIDDAIGGFAAGVAFGGLSLPHHRFRIMLCPPALPSLILGTLYGGASYSEGEAEHQLLLYQPCVLRPVSVAPPPAVNASQQLPLGPEPRPGSASLRR